MTNDDGVSADGIIALAEALAPVGEAIVVAPATEQSASSHAITLDKPLRMDEIGPGRYAVSGTPTDSVLLAVKSLLPRKPDLLVSGINRGPNMGEDVNYSGTVAAAIEGHILGIPSIAVSLASWDPAPLGPAAAASRYLAERMLERPGGPPGLWNVNVPAVSAEEIAGYRVTKLGSRVYDDMIVPKKDPRGKAYFWIGGGSPGWSSDRTDDITAVRECCISVTPLRIDLTDFKGIFNLEKRKLEWRTP